MTDDDLGIPPTLKRSPRDLTPAELNAEIARLNAKSRQDQAIKWKDENAPPPSPARLAQQERSREKSRVRIERLLAKKSGATTRMPLTGKQAWEKIMEDVGPKEQALRAQRGEEEKTSKPKTPRAKKPAIPQVEALPGMTALGIVPATITEHPAEEITVSIPRLEPEPTTEGVHVDPIPQAPADTEEKTVKTKTKRKAKGNGASAKPRKAPKAEKAAAKGTGKTKVEIIKGLLTRAKGCTTKDVLEATGWPSVSMPQQAKAARMTLQKEKTGSVTRYFASE